MSNSILNIRFGSWHFQVNRDAPRIRFTRNCHHDEARLIADRADLLNSLKEVVSEYDTPDNGRTLRWAIDEARAAIARATGEKEPGQ